MATAYVTLENVQGRALTGATLLIPDSQPDAATEALTTSGSNTQTTLEADQAGQVWVVDIGATDHWMAAGANPNATSGVRRRISGGNGPYYFSARVAGEKLSLVTA